MAQNGLNGIRSLSYMGVNAPQPPNIDTYNRAPTINDWSNFTIGDLWINILPAPAIYREVWMLVALERPTPLTHVATWIRISGGGGGGAGVLQTRTDDTLIEVPDMTGTLNIYGGEPYVPGATVVPVDYYTNIYTKQMDANSIWVSLTRSIHQPITNLSATEGMYSLGGSNFLFAYGTNNTACGIDAQNLTLDVPTCTDTTAIGFNCLHSIFDGAGNTGIGSFALNDVISGSDNIAIGYLAGDSYTTSESDNILIGNLGVILDANTIRIGIQGAGAAEQNQCFIAGIWNSPAVPATNTGLVIVDLNGQLYVDDLPPESIIATDIGGNPIGLQGLAGTVLTGRGIGTLPEFLPITSTGGTVTITTDPVTHSVNLEAAGIAGLVTLTTDTGVANPLLGNINVVGGELINTDNVVANTVTVNLNRGANDQVVAGTGASSAAYKYLWSSDGSITLDFLSDPTKIDLINNGTPPVGGITYLTGDTGPNATPIAGAVLIKGGKNIYTDSSVGQVEVNVTDDVSLLGWLHAVLDIQTSTGSLEAIAGHLYLPDTDAAGLGGTIVIGGHRFISNRGAGNTFVGELSGNITLNAATAINNTFIGAHVGDVITTGPNNVGLGVNALTSLTTGQQDTALGVNALGQIITSSYNIGIGYHAGFNYTSVASNSNICLMDPGLNGEANTMRLGSPVGVTPSYGTGSREINTTYIAGVYSKVPGPTPLIVTIGSDGKLGTGGVVPGGGAAIFIEDIGTANVSGSTIKILGGENINTTGATNVVKVNLDPSILQPATNASGSTGVYALGASDYVSDRFMHMYGGITNTWLGHTAGPLGGAVGTRLIGIGAGALNNNGTSTKSVGIGYLSMSSATASNGCVCIGDSSGLGLTVSANNVFLGYNSGSAVTTGSSCILIGASSATSAPTANNELHIGNATGVAGGNLNASYIHGIYGKAVATTNAAVYIDNTGKLGTIASGGSGNYSFSYYLANTIGPLTSSHVLTGGVTGDDTIYLLGTNGGLGGVQGFLTAEYDNTGGNFYPGNGINSKAVFTAPADGQYQINSVIMSTNVSSGISPARPTGASISPLYIYTSSGSYAFKCQPLFNVAYAASVDVSESASTVVTLTAGQTVYWGMSWNLQATPTVRNIGLSGTQVIGGTTFRMTYISGFRIA